jgi:hypothetical protein
MRQKAEDTPDEIHQEKAMLEPAAPATLWLYPDLKLLAGTEQRSALAEAGRRARRYRIIRVLRFSTFAVAMLGIWLIEVERDDLRERLPYVLFLLLLASILFTHLRTRAELRSAIKQGANRAEPSNRGS